MQVKPNINPHVLAGAVGLLQPYCPGLTANTLVDALEKQKQIKQEMLTIREYAAKYKICIMTVNRMIRRGELNAVRIGKRCIRIVV